MEVCGESYNMAYFPLANLIMTDSRLLQTVQYTTPASGTTINANNTGNLVIFINPAGSLLTLTLNLNGSPQNGDKMSIASSQVVTTFTMSNGTIVGALTSLAAATFATYIYSSDASEWFRTG